MRGVEIIGQGFGGRRGLAEAEAEVGGFGDWEFGIELLRLEATEARALKKFRFWIMSWEGLMD